MTSTSRSNSGRRRRFALFVRFARFEIDRIALRRFRLEAFGASGRFTTWLRRSRRGPQLHQKGWHGSSNLGQCQNRAARLPRSIDALNQGTCQHQLVVCARDDVRPTFRLRWGTQPWHVPEQHLLVQAVAMLMRVAQTIGRANLGQGCRLVAFPDKPTDLGVTPTFAGPMADDLDHAHLNPASGAQMQLLPAMHFDPLALGIRAFPTRIWFAMGTGIAALKPCSIFATGTALTRLARWGRTVKDAIAFDAQQTPGGHIGHPCQKWRARVPAISDD